MFRKGVVLMFFRPKPVSLPKTYAYYAQTCRQQYPARHANGYCGLLGIGVSCPIGFTREAAH